MNNHLRMQEKVLQEHIHNHALEQEIYWASELDPIWRKNIKYFQTTTTLKKNKNLYLENHGRILNCPKDQIILQVFSNKFSRRFRKDPLVANQHYSFIQRYNFTGQSAVDS